MILSGRRVPQNLNDLWKSNAAPSDTQRAAIESKLAVLKAEFRLLAGQPYSHDLSAVALNTIPNRALKVHKDIRGYQALISGQRSMPVELWQHIFAFVVQDGANQYHRLDTICRVSRVWKAAATSHSLFCYPIPSTISFVGPRSMSPKDHAALNHHIQFHIDRSGSLPISFVFRCEDLFDASGFNSIEYQDPTAQVRATLQILVAHSSRWEEAKFVAPMEILRLLSQNLRSPLPALRKLEYIMHKSKYEPHSDKIHVDCFSDAPRLRHVVFNTIGVFASWTDQGSFNLNLPWSQLETFRGQLYRSTAYHQIVAESHNLKVLEYTSNKAVSLPSTPTTFPHLEKLTLRFGPGITEKAFLSHLDSLTLPSLEDLELRGSFNGRNSLVYNKLIALILRSGAGCSIRRLSFDHTITGNFQSLATLLSLCPSLTHLEMSSLFVEAQLFALLTLDLRSPDPVVPKLKVFALCEPPAMASVDDPFTHLVGDAVHITDPAAIMRMTQSRTEALGDSYDKGTFGSFEEMRFLHFSGLTAMEYSELASQAFGPSGANEDLTYLAWSVNVDVLRDRFIEPLPTWFVDRYDPFLHWRMHKDLRKLEVVDIAGRDGRILARHGILQALHHIGQMQSGIIPGDAIWGFRRRARNLVEKWKPSLLREYRASPYRWTFVDRDFYRLRYVPASSTIDWSERDTGELWKEIIGSGMREVLGLSSATPWLSP